MKKILSMCVFLVVICSALITVNIFQTKDLIRTNTIEKTDDSFNFYVTESQISGKDEIKEFTRLANQYQVNIFLSTTNSQGATVKSVVYQRSSFPYDNFGLHSKKLFPGQNNYYASFPTGSKYQIGKIPVFYSKNHVILQTLARYHQKNNRTANGSFTVVGAKAADKTKIIHQLSLFFGITPTQLQTKKFEQRTEMFNKNLGIFLLILGIAVLIFLLVVVYLPVSKMHTIGVMKLNGWKNGAIIWSFIRPGIITLLGTSVVVDLIILVLYRHFLPHTLLPILVGGQVGLAILYLFTNLAVYLLVYKTTIRDLLKNHFNFTLGTWLAFGLKGLLTLITTILLVQTSFGITETIRQAQQVKDWQRYGEVLTLDKVMLADQEQATKTLTKLYADLDQNTDTMYVRSVIVNPAKELTTSTQRSEFAASERYPIMTVNENYIQNKVPQLSSLLKVKSNTRLYLIPRKYQNRSKMLRLVQSFQYSLLNSEQQAHTSVKKMNVKLVYYDDRQTKVSVFAYDFDINKRLRAPIFSIVTPANMTFFDKETLSDTSGASPLKIPPSKATMRAVRQAITKTNASYLKLHFATMNSMLSDTLSENNEGLALFTLMLVTVFCLNRLASVFLLMCIIQNKARSLAIKKILGIKLTERYKWEGLVALALYAIQFFVVLVFGSSKLILIFALVMIILDALISAGFISIVERRNLPAVLKGE